MSFQLGVKVRVTFMINTAGYRSSWDNISVRAGVIFRVQVRVKVKFSV